MISIIGKKGRGSNGAEAITVIQKHNFSFLFFYDPVLGGWGNTRSAIRLSKQGLEQDFPTTNGILSDTEYREFLVEFANDFIKVSRVGEPPFMSFQNPTSFDVAYIGISSGWGSDGYWQFCGFGK